MQYEEISPRFIYSQFPDDIDLGESANANLRALLTTLSSSQQILRRLSEESERGRLRETEKIARVSRIVNGLQRRAGEVLQLLQNPTAANVRKAFALLGPEFRYLHL